MLLIIVLCVAAGCFMGGSLYAVRLVAKRFLKQKYDSNKYSAENDLLVNSALRMKKVNVFLYVNGIENPEISEIFLRSFADAYSKSSMRSDFKEVNLRLGYAVNKSVISKEVAEELVRFS